MSSTGAETNAPSTNPATSLPSGVTTRQQTKKLTDQQDAINDAEANDNNRKHHKPKAVFKGDVEKLNGKVFQLAEEGAKRNQFNETMNAIKRHMYLEYENVEDLAPLFQTPCADTKIDPPDDEPPFSADGKTRVNRDHRLYYDWREKCTEYRTRTTALQGNKTKLFNIILSQCSQSVTMKLEATKGYETAEAAHDCYWLIRSLKNICHHFEQAENRYMALYKAKAAIILLKQGSNQPTSEYFKLFQESVAILESYGGQLHDTESAAPPNAKIASLSATERNAFMRDRYCAAAFLSNADPGHYGPLLDTLSNSFTMGRDEYPTSLDKAYQLLLQFKDTSKPPGQPHTRGQRHHNRRNDGRGGPQSDSGRGGYGNRSGGRGSASSHSSGATTTTTPSPAAPKTDKSFAQIGFSLTQVDNHFPDGIPDHYVLLDSDSTVSIFRNLHLLTNIREVDPPLFLETNGGGNQISTQMGTIPNFGDVWYNPDSIANILSLAHVRKHRRVS
jgi:hypothetical protein